MYKKFSGFTLIELIVVIVILGILAATAAPKFIDLRTDAKRAKAEGVGGAVASASAMNYAKFLLVKDFSAEDGSVDNYKNKKSSWLSLNSDCSSMKNSVVNLLQDPKVLDDYNFSGDGCSNVESGKNGFCNISDVKDGAFDPVIQFPITCVAKP